MIEIYKRYKHSDYFVSNLGNVQNIVTGLILKPTITRYAHVVLYIGDKPKIHSVHRLVAELFIENPSNKPQVNHIDGNRANNTVTNLEWCTQSENQIHAFATGLQMSRKGEAHHNSRLSAEEVLQIKELLESREYSGPEIAEAFGVQQQLISKINKGHRWSHITGWTPDNRKDVTVDYGSFIRSSISKLSADDIPVIRGLIAEGKTDSEVSNLFSVHKGTINQIRNGKTWKNY